VRVLAPRGLATESGWLPVPTTIPAAFTGLKGALGAQEGSP